MLYSDILLGRDGDIRLDEFGDAVPGNSIVQNINIRLKWFLGEWEFDRSKGMDWFGEAFIKNPDNNRIARMVRNELAQTEGITSVESVDVSADPKTRTAVIVWSARAGSEALESEVRLWANTA